MIALPFNDLGCLGSITEVVAELVDNRDDVIVELARKHADTTSLADWIRGLPQRDDEGERGDGPKVDACKPPQRLRVPAPDPNCVERSALYLAVAELIDPGPVRQLATLDTAVGLHTFPVENGAPVILDPRVPRNALEGGLALVPAGVIEVDARDAIEWTLDLADQAAREAGAPRNGPGRVRRARNAVVRLVEDGAAPASREVVEVIAWVLAMAEKFAHRYGPRAIAIVRTTAQAIADLAETVIERSRRNFALEIGGTRLTPAPWMSALARIAGNVGAQVGAVALRSKLASLGIEGDMIGLVEEELNREGYTMGAFARPSKLKMFGASRTA